MNTRHLFRRRAPFAAALALAAFAGGCTVGPNYKRPDLEPPAQFRGVQASAAESMADLPWWQVFDDQVLQSLIREGIARNLDLRIASARVVESRALAGIAKSYLYPEVNVGFGYSAEQQSRVGDPQLTKDAVPNRLYQNVALNGTLSWEIDLFGRLRRGQEAAFAQYLASEQGRRAVVVTLVGDIASTYFFLRELDLELEIAKRTLKVNDDTVSYYATRLEGGVSNRLEVDQAKANRAVTAASIPGLERQIALAENALAVLLGRPPAAIPRGRAHDSAARSCRTANGPPPLARPRARRALLRSPRRPRGGRRGAQGVQASRARGRRVPHSRREGAHARLRRRGAVRRQGDGGEAPDAAVVSQKGISPERA